MKEQFTDQTIEQFTALFGRAGDFGGFNDLKKITQSLNLETGPPNDTNLQSEIGLAGINLTSRASRNRWNDLGPTRSLNNFQDLTGNNLNADEVLF